MQGGEGGARRERGRREDAPSTPGRQPKRSKGAQTRRREGLSAPGRRGGENLQIQGFQENSFGLASCFCDFASEPSLNLVRQGHSGAEIRVFQFPAFSGQRNHRDLGRRGVARGRGSVDLGRGQGRPRSELLRPGSTRRRPGSRAGSTQV